MAMAIFMLKNICSYRWLEFGKNMEKEYFILSKIIINKYWRNIKALTWLKLCKYAYQPTIKFLNSTKIV